MQMRHFQCVSVPDSTEHGHPFFIAELKFSFDKYSVDNVWTKIYCHFYFREITLIKWNHNVANQLLSPVLLVKNVVATWPKDIIVYSDETRPYILFPALHTWASTPRGDQICWSFCRLKFWCFQAFQQMLVRIYHKFIT